MADREELTPEEAARMLEQQSKCRACGVPVGRGIGRCRRCEVEGREAPAVNASTNHAAESLRRRTAALDAALADSAPSSTSLAVASKEDGFTIAMWAMTIVGVLFTAGGGSNWPDGAVALWFGGGLLGLAVTGWVIRGAIVSALRAHAAERSPTP